MSLRPPSLTVTVMEVEPASRLFSTSSFTAETGRWMTSPAAIRLTTDFSRRWMRGGSIGAGGRGVSVSIGCDGDCGGEGSIGRSNCGRGNLAAK